MYSLLLLAILGFQAHIIHARPHLSFREEKDPTQLGALPNQYLVSDPQIATNELHLYNVYGPSVVYFFGNYMQDNGGRVAESVPLLMGAVFPNPENITDNQVIIDMIVENVKSIKYQGDQTPPIQKAWFAQVADSARHVADGTNTTVIEQLSAALMPVNVNFPATFPATPYLLGSPLNPLSNLSAIYDAEAGFFAFVNNIPSAITDLYGH